MVGICQISEQMCESLFIVNWQLWRDWEDCSNGPGEEAVPQSGPYY